MSSRMNRHGSGRGWLYGALAAASMVGCATGPDFQPASLPFVASFTREGQANAESAGLATDWWRAYGSPRVNALVERALKNNPNLDAAIANLKATQENVTAQNGFFYPSVQAGYSVTRQNIGNVLSTPLASGSTLYNLHTAQLNVGFVPDVFGGNRRQVESIKASALSQKYQLDALRITLVSNVVAAALQEQLLLAQIKVAGQAVDAAGQLRNQLRAMVATGYSSGIDVAQQDAAYAQTASLLPPLRKQLEQTRDLLAVLCGQLPAQALPDGADEAIVVPGNLPRILPSSLVGHRPDVQAAQEQLHSAFAQIGVAQANMLPQFSLSANLAYSAGGLAGLLSPANQAWGLAAGLTQPLFEGGALRARKRAAIDLADGARAQYQAVVLTAFQNVADTLYALDADGRALAAAEDVSKATEQVLELTQRQLAGGYVSRPAYLAANQAYLQARLAALGARATYAGDTVALYQALGGGWAP